ncbi:MAG: hypothetical protein NTY86_17915 [Deltaproteobacteria bacterium]|nr:hypothetical protein [Deltaproteobacteria bacterium]
MTTKPAGWSVRQWLAGFSSGERELVDIGRDGGVAGYLLQDRM